jgi:hypothetical protein
MDDAPGDMPGVEGPPGFASLAAPYGSVMAGSDPGQRYGASHVG